VNLPRFIPRAWLGPRRNQATQGDHRHLIGDDKTGYISMPLFNGEAPVDGDEFIALLESYGLDISLFTGFGGGGGVTDHGALSGLADDDHPQYLTEAEADALYSVLAHTHTLEYPTRTTASVTTASLADLAVETGTINFPDGARLLKLDVDIACRVRLYVTSAQRTADAARAIGTEIDITTDHGLLFEYVATAGIDTYLSPSVDIYEGDGETSTYYSIQNRSGSTDTVTAIFDYLRTE
jgi:hypothetical protein